MNTDELRKFEAEADGVVPRSQFLIDGESIDRPIAEKPCDSCGKKRKYVAVYDDGTYYAFSVCYPCDDVIEF